MACVIPNCNHVNRDDRYVCDFHVANLPWSPIYSNDGHQSTVIKWEYQNIEVDQTFKLIPATPNPNKLAQELTVWFHNKTCHDNHIDMCGYDYEDWDTGSYPTKYRWMERATKFFTEMPDDLFDFVVSQKKG